MIYKTKSSKETQKIASELVLKLQKSRPQKHAVVIALEGELGAGKTTFVKAFAKKLGIKSHITSPTFVLMKQYPIKKSAFKLLIHIDAYRLTNYKDLLPLGIKELISNPENVILIEWSERVKQILPSKCFTVHIDHTGENQRKISIINHA
jgi:tRNA threonylcarbamoyladenosine biosynthesis protein TsaE